MSEARSYLNRWRQPQPGPISCPAFLLRSCFCSIFWNSAPLSLRPAPCPFPFKRKLMYFSCLYPVLTPLPKTKTKWCSYFVRIFSVYCTVCTVLVESRSWIKLSEAQSVSKSSGFSFVSVTGTWSVHIRYLFLSGYNSDKLWVHHFPTTAYANGKSKVRFVAIAIVELC